MSTRDGSTAHSPRGETYAPADRRSRKACPGGAEAAPAAVPVHR
ncbi:hypothetical protein [Streptomyces sp. NPDC058330]